MSRLPRRVIRSCLGFHAILTRCLFVRVVCSTVVLVFVHVSAPTAVLALVHVLVSGGADACSCLGPRRLFVFRFPRHLFVSRFPRHLFVSQLPRRLFMSLFPRRLFMSQFPRRQGICFIGLYWIAKHFFICVPIAASISKHFHWFVDCGVGFNIFVVGMLIGFKPFSLVCWYFLRCGLRSGIPEKWRLAFFWRCWLQSQIPWLFYQCWLQSRIQRIFVCVCHLRMFIFQTVNIQTRIFHSAHGVFSSSVSRMSLLHWQIKQLFTHQHAQQPQRRVVSTISFDKTGPSRWMSRGLHGVRARCSVFGIWVVWLRYNCSHRAKMPDLISFIALRGKNNKV